MQLSRECPIYDGASTVSHVARFEDIPSRVSMGSAYTFEKFGIGRDMLDGIY